MLWNEFHPNLYKLTVLMKPVTGKSDSKHLLETIYRHLICQSTKYRHLFLGKILLLVEKQYIV